MKPIKSLNYNINEDFNNIKSNIINNKDEFKNKSLKNTLVIRGIGEKYIKIENNFYSWDEIYNNLNKYKEGQPTDPIILSILSWIFKEINSNETYSPRKFDLNEEFNSIKEEILTHKAYYKTGLITGFGENNIKITTNTGKEYYIEWNELEKIVNDIKYSSFNDLTDKRFSTSIIRQLFKDNDEYYNEEELNLLNEEYGKIKLKYYRLCIKGMLSYKLIKEEVDDLTIKRSIVKSALIWNNGQLPLSITDEGVNHIILDKSSLVRADLRINEHFTKVLQKELDLDFKVYSTEYGDEYIYHVHQYKNLIKFERDCYKWTITYNNKNLMQNAFRKILSKTWNCELNTAKSTEVCVIEDFENKTPFDPNYFVKLYKRYQR